MGMKNLSSSMNRKKHNGFYVVWRGSKFTLAGKLVLFLHPGHMDNSVLVQIRSELSK